MLGHVAALVLAHDRALVLYPNPKLAVRSQYWMLGDHGRLHSLALWLLAQAGAERLRALSAGYNIISCHTRR